MIRSSRIISILQTLPHSAPTNSCATKFLCSAILCNCRTQLKKPSSTVPRSEIFHSHFQLQNGGEQVSDLFLIHRLVITFQLPTASMELVLSFISTKDQVV